MKKTALVRYQLVAFAILAVVSLVYGTIHYIGLSRVTGIGTYSVSADFEDSGGIYEAALVTYRGVTVGRVTDIELRYGGAKPVVRTTLQIDSGTDIPSSAGAHIKSMSAIGEQYVDLVPDREDGTYLLPSSVIPAERNTTPTPTKDVLGKTQALLDTLDTKALGTVVDETYNAFDGTGPALSTLIDSSQNLIHLAQADIGPTLALVNDAEPLLNTGNDVAPDIRGFSTDLASFTEQLVMDDQQIRSILDQGPAAANEASALLTGLAPTLPVLLSDLQTLGQVFRVNIPQIEQVLTVYPALAAVTNYSVKDFPLGGTDPNGPQAPLDIKLGNTINPPVCTEGYQGTERRDPSEVGPAPVAPGQHCAVAPEDPKVSRGARNIPCATDAAVRSSDVANCPRGLPSTWPKAVPYTDDTGEFTAPDGTHYVLGETDQEEDQWQSLLTK